VWLSRMDSEMGLCEAISEYVQEWRRRKGRHSLASLVKQRVFQIACGYDEDQNDSDTLRQDPLLKMVCGSLPEGGPDLASQPTICRLENAATLLIVAGDNPQRLRSEACFASLCGVSPIEASSGKVVRHRLNRGGNREANRARCT